MDCEVILLVDLNAKAIEWGMGWTDAKGRVAVENSVRHDFIVLNTGCATTFLRARTRKSIIRTTLAILMNVAECCRNLYCATIYYIQ